MAQRVVLIRHGDDPADDRLGARHDAAQHDWFMGFFDRLFGGI